jgi:hypothetical protein
MSSKFLAIRSLEQRVVSYHFSARKLLTTSDYGQFHLLLIHPHPCFFDSLEESILQRIFDINFDSFLSELHRSDISLLDPDYTSWISAALGYDDSSDFQLPYLIPRFPFNPCISLSNAVEIIISTRRQFYLRDPKLSLHLPRLIDKIFQGLIFPQISFFQDLSTPNLLELFIQHLHNFSHKVFSSPLSVDLKLSWLVTAKGYNPASYPFSDWHALALNLEPLFNLEVFMGSLPHAVHHLISVQSDFSQNPSIIPSRLSSNLFPQSITNSIVSSGFQNSSEILSSNLSSTASRAMTSFIEPALVASNPALSVPSLTSDIFFPRHTSLSATSSVLPIQHSLGFTYLLQQESPCPLIPRNTSSRSNIRRFLPRLPLCFYSTRVTSLKSKNRFTLFSAVALPPLCDRSMYMQTIVHSPILLDLTQLDSCSLTSSCVPCSSISSDLGSCDLLSSSIIRSPISFSFSTISPWYLLLEGLSKFSMVLGDAVLSYCDKYDRFIKEYDALHYTLASPTRDAVIISMFLSRIQPFSALSAYDFSMYDD